VGAESSQVHNNEALQLQVIPDIYHQIKATT